MEQDCNASAVVEDPPSGLVDDPNNSTLNAEPDISNKDTNDENEDVVVKDVSGANLDDSQLGKLNFLLDKTEAYSTFIRKSMADAVIGAAPKKVKNNEGDAAPASADDSIPDIIKAKLLHELRDYQVDAVRWLVSLYLNGLNGILADEMGLGKTVVTIAFFAVLLTKKVNGPFLVVAPVSTLSNWYNEIARFTGDMFRRVMYHGPKKDRLVIVNNLKKQYAKRKARDTIVVTSYDIAMKDLRLLKNFHWRYLVVDEAHRLKNMDCKLVNELKKLTTDNRLLLTGTPLQNNLAELWSLLNFILPQLFDDLSQFQRWFNMDDLEAGLAEKVAATGTGAAVAAAASAAAEAISGAKERDTTASPAADDDDSASPSPGVANKPARHTVTIHNDQQRSIIYQMHQILQPFMLRRLKTEVGLSLPPKREVVVYAGMTPRQRERYNAIRDGTYKELLSREAASSGKIVPTHTSLSHTVMQLRKMCNHPFLFPALDPHAAHVQRVNCDTVVETYLDVEGAAEPVVQTFTFPRTQEILVDEFDPTDPAQRAERLDLLINECGKFKLLNTMLKKLKASGHKVLIFSQMVRLLNLLEEYIEYSGWKCNRIDGSRTLTERQAAIDEFNNSSDPECWLFILSTRAGGLGINLTGADTVIIYDSDWNPQADLQAQDRAHRIGQSRQVVVYRLISADSIEQRLLARATSKLRLEHLVIQRGNFSGQCMNKSSRFRGRFSQQDLEDVMKMQCGDHHVKEVSDDMLELLLDRPKLMSLLASKTMEQDSARKEQEESLLADGLMSKLQKTGDVNVVLDEIQVEEEPELKQGFQIITVRPPCATT